jgi:hypothetical protein
MKMAKESARYNLGELYYRTVNLPTFALRVLRPASRKRIAFSKAGEERVDGTTTWVVTFQEAKGPTFSATARGTDIPSHGRFWVEPDTGVVLRSEMILGGTRSLSARAAITVTYRLEPSLGFRIPIEMRERYDNPRSERADVVVALATYSDFRRFDWRTLILPGPPATGDLIGVSRVLCNLAAGIAGSMRAEYAHRRQSHASGATLSGFRWQGGAEPAGDSR